MHSENSPFSTLAMNGIGCLPKLPGNPALQTTGRTLDHVARIYDAIEPLMMMGMESRIQQEVIELLGLKGNERVLDVGCGTGTLTRRMASLSPRPSCVVGVDAATAMIDVATRKATGIPNVVFEAALAEQLPFTDRSFDCAVSTMFFHHINAGLKGLALNEMWRVLMPGSRAVIVDVAKPTHAFGAMCAWAGYLLFQQEEIRENIEGRLEEAFDASFFRSWRRVAHHSGYVSVYELKR